MKEMLIATEIVDLSGKFTEPHELKGELVFVPESNYSLEDIQMVDFSNGSFGLVGCVDSDGDVTVEGVCDLSPPWSMVRFRKVDYCGPSEAKFCHKYLGQVMELSDDGKKWVVGVLEEILDGGNRYAFRAGCGCFAFVRPVSHKDEIEVNGIKYRRVV